MAQYVVIGTAPTVDVTVAVGPFRSLARVREADEELTAKGYNTETCQLFDVDEVELLSGWDEERSDGRE